MNIDVKVVVIPLRDLYLLINGTNPPRGYVDYVMV